MINFLTVLQLLSVPQSGDHDQESLYLLQYSSFSQLVLVFRDVFSRFLELSQQCFFQIGQFMNIPFEKFCQNRIFKHFFQKEEIS